MSELCSVCQVVEVGPYCPEHGLVHRPFSLGDRYDVDALIAEGPGAFVFAAEDLIASRSVLVKVLRSQVADGGVAEQRFLREAAALSKHPDDHLVRITDVGQDAALGVSFLVMERLPGQTAAALVRQTGPLPWDQAVPLLLQLCRAVAAAHQRGITDGGLTAANLFVLDGDGSVAKLCDVGFTSARRSPEGNASADPRDDAYGIATVAYELLTGAPPPDRRGPRGSFHEPASALQDPLQALRLPDRLSALIVACRARDPKLRPGLDAIEVTLLALDTSFRTAEAPTVLGVLHADSLPAAAMIGSYRVVAEIGSGGTGRVYLGEHPVIGSKVAIKVLLPEIASNPETVERFIQEARASSQIGSPHIPRYFDFGTTPSGLPYAIMEYFEGETLGQRLARVGKLSVADTAQIVQQVARALVMAHEAGLVHRDLKPDNILLVKPDGKPRTTPQSAAPIWAEAEPPALEVKLLDFGIAKVMANGSANQTLTGVFLGTPFYCAPEQVFGFRIDARADVYGLGATAFEMLTGAPPFVGEVPEILAAKATAEAPDLRKAGLPAAVAHTIRKMLARDPDQRASSMAWVLEQVAGWANDDAAAAGPMMVAATSAELASTSGGGSTSSAITDVVGPQRRAWPGGAVLIAGGALVALVGILAVVLRGSQPPARPLAPSAGSAISQPVASPTPTAPRPSAPAAVVREPTTPAAGSATAPEQPAAADPPAPARVGSAPGSDAIPTRQPSQASQPSRSTRSPTDDHGARTVTHHPVVVKPDKKPPPKKPHEAKLIVDPYGSDD